MAFSRRKIEQVACLLHNMLDQQGSDVVVVRASECQVLFMNEPARQRIDPALEDPTDCKSGYARCFPQLCSKCPGMEEPQVVGETARTQLEDEEGRMFTLDRSTLEWLDAKPATALFLRDTHEVHEASEKLYKLAYIDQLTGIPNRQKFKEDFECVRPAIESGELGGVVAIFDLDNFKSVNDTYGHNTGDIMLRRLAEHIHGDPGFEGHLYRLGGDEFVLFYAERGYARVSALEAQAHYGELFARTLQPYTLPSIELACTISMGIALLPGHGTSASELLRKADIALYKAKAGGRNQLAFFEDRYDTAQKLKDVYINMQPILLLNGRTFGYELIDKGNEEENDAQSVNLSDFNRTMDALGLEDIQSDVRYFIPYTKSIDNASVRNNLPKDKFVIEIALSVQCAAEDIKLYTRLRSFGYALAFTGLRQTNALPPLMKIATYAKFAPGSMDATARERLIALYPHILFIATDVNTHEACDLARRQGFKLLQGFFFDKPAVVKKSKEIDPLKLNYLRLLKLSSTDGYVDFQEISEVIAADVALSYKLLRLLNSAAVGLRYRISSIAMAVAYLGEENLKKWIALLAIRGIASDKPSELLRMSLVRAQFGELLAPHCTKKRDVKHVFMVGMFSLLHIALDKSKQELLDEIPVAEEIRDSLLTKTGIYSDMVAFFSNYEYGNWEEINRFAEENGLSSQRINESYIAAVKWYNELADE